MTLAQLERLLDTYGAAAEHWPATERAAAERLLATSADAQGLLAAARRLEETITAALRSEPSDADVERLVGAFARPLPPQRHGIFARWWPAALARADFAPAWPRVAVLACVAALGFAVGLTNVSARLAADLSPRFAALAPEDVSANLFDTDAITGLQ
jgi:hypothetical protein